MAVMCRAEGRTLYAALEGEVDHHRARGILAELDRQMDAARPLQVTLDLGGVTFMDSSGIAILLRLHHRTVQWAGMLRVIHVPEQAGKVLRAAGLERLITFE